MTREFLARLNLYEGTLIVDTLVLIFWDKVQQYDGGEEGKQAEEC